MTIEHQQYGHPCPCDIKEVTEREAQFLELMDNWYGDKGYRQHSEWLEILTAVTAMEGPRECAACVAGSLEHETTDACRSTHTPYKNCGEECCTGPDDLGAAIDAKIAEVAEKAWGYGFAAGSERLVDVSKRLTVLELLCAGAAHRGQDDKFQDRWKWYKNLPMVDAFKDTGIDKAVLIATLEDNEPEWTAGDDLSCGWRACVNYIAKHL